MRTGSAEPPSPAASPVVAAPRPQAATPPDADALRAAASIVVALGGPQNIVSAKACALTRVRVEVANRGVVQEAALQQHTAAVMHVGGNVLHLIVGTKADAIASALASEVHLVTRSVRL